MRQEEPDAVMILVVPPRAAPRSNACGPGATTRSTHRAGCLVADEEERVGRKLAQHVVVNDVLDRAVAEVAGIIASYAARGSSAVPN